MAATTHHTIAETKEVTTVTDELRNYIANFEDFFRPIRSYFYWEKHCHDIPICWSLKSVFESVDGVDELSDKMHDLIKDLDQLDALMPQLVAQFPPMIATVQSARTMMQTMHSTMAGVFGEMDDMTQNANAMGQAFDAAKNDDSFYLPPEIFQNKDFQHAMSSFLSPDGKAARFIISQRGDPGSPEGLRRAERIKPAAEEALKSTPLANAKIYVAGTAATFKDFRDGVQVRPTDRGNRCALPHSRHHADHDAKFDCRAGYCGHDRAVAGRIVWTVGAGLAIYAGHQIALDGACILRDHSIGGRVRLQPIVGVPDERGTARRV